MATMEETEFARVSEVPAAQAVLRWLRDVDPKPALDRFDVAELERVLGRLTATKETQLRLTLVVALREIEELQYILLDDYEITGSVIGAAQVAMDAVSNMATHVLTRSEVGAIEAMVDGEERPEAKADDGILEYLRSMSL